MGCQRKRRVNNAHFILSLATGEIKFLLLESERLVQRCFFRVSVVWEILSKSCLVNESEKICCQSGAHSGGLGKNCICGSH